MQRSALVTGGYGFIGAHAVRALLGAGYRVAVIDRELAGNAATDILTGDELSAVEHAAASMPDASQLADLMRERAVTDAIHLASPLATRTEGTPEAVIDEMIAPHRVVLDACRLAGVRRLIWASSVGVFGRRSDYAALPIPNDAPHVPQTLYGAGKAFLEQLTSKYSERYGLSALGLRFPLVYGPGRRRGGGQFTTELIEGVALGERVIVANGDLVNDWLFVEDAAQSIVRAIDSDACGAVTITGHVATTRAVAGLLRLLFPEADLTIDGGAGDLVAEFDSTAALAKIGYRPETSLADGVLATANAARARRGLPAVTG